MPLRALQTQIPKNTQWVSYCHGQYTRTYVSADQITINAFTAQWELESPYSYGIILLTYFPSASDIARLKQQEQYAYIRVDSSLYFTNTRDDIILITQNPEKVANIDNYLFETNLISNQSHYIKLTMLDLITFKLITDFNLFDNPYASSPSLYHPQRLTDMWNTVNPDLPAHDLEYAWLSPHITGERISNKNIATCVLNYYKLYRVIIFDPFDDAILWVNGAFICKKVANTLQKTALYSEHHLQKFNDPNSALSIRLANRYATERNKIIVKYIWNLLYITKKLPPNDISNDYISDAVFEKLFFFQQKNLNLTASILYLLTKITQLEIQDRDQPTPSQNNGLCNKISVKFYTNLLMYIVILKPHHTSRFLNNLTPDTLKHQLINRNSFNKNALDLALTHSPESRDSILLTSIQLNFEDQEELLHRIKYGRYKNTFEYTATEYPQLYNQIKYEPIWSEQEISIDTSNLLLNNLKINVLLKYIELELKECQTNQLFSNKLNAIDELYQALLYAKYLFLFSTKCKDETYQLFKKHCVSAFSTADTQLIHAHYYWEQNQFTSLFLRPKLNFIKQYKETKSRVSRLKVADENISIRLDTDFLVVTTNSHI